MEANTLDIVLDVIMNETNISRYTEQEPGYVELLKKWRTDYWNELMDFTAVYSTLAVLGIVGNALVLWAYLGKKVLQMTVYFVLALAVVDLLTSLIIMPMTIYFMWRLYVPYTFICIIVEMGRSTLIPVSSMLLAAVAIERYLLICHSLHFHLRKVHIITTIAVLFLLGMGMGILPSLAYGVTTNSGYFLGHCQTVYTIISYDVDRSYTYFLTAFFTLMALIIIIFYSLIFAKVYMVDRHMLMYKGGHRSKHTSHSTKQEGLSPDQTARQTDRGTDLATKNLTSEARPAKTSKCSFVCRPPTLLQLEDHSDLEDHPDLKVHPDLKDHPDRHNKKPDLKKETVHEIGDPVKLQNKETSDGSDKEEPPVFNTVSHEEFGHKAYMLTLGQKNFNTTEYRNHHNEYTIQDINGIHHKYIGNSKAEHQDLEMYSTPGSLRGAGPCKPFDNAETLVLKAAEKKPDNEDVDKEIPGSVPDRHQEPGIRARTVIINTQVNLTIQNASTHIYTNQNLRSDKSVHQGQPRGHVSAHWSTACVMLLVSLGFIASYLPCIIYWYLPTSSSNPRQQIPHYLYFLNNIINPIIYSLTNRNFRHALADSCRCVSCKNKVAPHSGNIQRHH